MRGKVTQKPLIACLLVAAAAVAGCTAGEIGPIDTGSVIELGTGEATFQPLEDDATLEVVLGTQGGYHVVGNARLFGYVPGPILGEQPDGMHFEVVAYNGQRLNLDSGVIHTPLAPQPDGSFTCLPGHHVLVDVLPEDIDGTPALFTVQMAGVDGELLTDERRVILHFVGP